MRVRILHITLAFVRAGRDFLSIPLDVGTSAEITLINGNRQRIAAMLVQILRCNRVSARAW